MKMSKQDLREAKKTVKLYSEHEFVEKKHREVFKKLLKHL